MLDTRIAKKQSSRTIVGPILKEIIDQQEKQKLIGTQDTQDSFQKVLKGDVISPELFRLRCLGNALVKEWNVKSREVSALPERISKNRTTHGRPLPPLRESLAARDDKSSRKENMKKESQEEKNIPLWRQIGYKGGAGPPQTIDETSVNASCSFNDYFSSPLVNSSERSKEYTEIELRNNPMLQRLQVVLRRIKTAEVIYRKALQKMTRHPRSEMERLEQLFVLEQMKTILFVGRRYNIVKHIEDILDSAIEAKDRNLPYLANAPAASLQDIISGQLVNPGTSTEEIAVGSFSEKKASITLKKEPKVNLQDVAKKVADIQKDFFFSRPDLQTDDFQLSALEKLNESIQEHNDYVESIIHEDVKHSALHHKWDHTLSESNFKEICWLIESLDLGVGLSTVFEEELVPVPPLIGISQKGREGFGAVVQEKGPEKRGSLDSAPGENHLVTKGNASLKFPNSLEDVNKDKTFLTSSFTLPSRRFSGAIGSGMTTKRSSAAGNIGNEVDDEPSLVGFSLDDLDRLNRRRNKNFRIPGKLFNLNLLNFMTEAIPDELFGIKEEEENKSLPIASLSGSFFLRSSPNIQSARPDTEKDPFVLPKKTFSPISSPNINRTVTSPELHGYESDDEGEGRISNIIDDANVIRVFRLAAGDKKFRRVLNLRPDLLNSMRKLYQLHNYTVFIDEIRSLEASQTKRSKEDWIAEIERKLQEKGQMDVGEDDYGLGLSFGREGGSASLSSRAKSVSPVLPPIKADEGASAIEKPADDEAPSKLDARNVSPLQREKLHLTDDEDDYRVDILHKESLACGVEVKIKGHLSAAHAARRRAGLLSPSKTKKNMYEIFSIVCDNPTSLHAQVSVQVLRDKLKKLKISPGWKVDSVHGIRQLVGPASSVLFLEFEPERTKGEKKGDTPSFDGAFIFLGRLIESGLSQDELDDEISRYESIPQVSDDIFTESPPEKWGIGSLYPTENAIRNNMAALSILQMGSAGNSEENSTVVNALSAKLGKHKVRKSNTNRKAMSKQKSAKTRRSKDVLTPFDWKDDDGNNQEKGLIHDRGASSFFTGTNLGALNSGLKADNKINADTRGLHDVFDRTSLREMGNKDELGSIGEAGSTKAFQQKRNEDGSSSAVRIAETGPSHLASPISKDTLTVEKRPSEACRAAANAGGFSASDKAADGESSAAGFEPGVSLRKNSKVSSRRGSKKVSKKKVGKSKTDRSLSISSATEGKVKKKKGVGKDFPGIKNKETPGPLHGVSPHLKEELAKFLKYKSGDHGSSAPSAREILQIIDKLAEEGYDIVGKDKDGHLVFKGKDAGDLYVMLENANLVPEAEVGITEGNITPGRKEDIILELKKQAEKSRRQLSPSSRSPEIWEGGIQRPPTISIISKDSKPPTVDEVGSYVSIGGIRFDTTEEENMLPTASRASPQAEEAVGGLLSHESSIQSGRLSKGEKPHHSSRTQSTIKQCTSKEAKRYIAEVAQQKRKDRLKKIKTRNNTPHNAALFQLDDAADEIGVAIHRLNEQGPPPIYVAPSKSSNELHMFLPIVIGNEAEKDFYSSPCLQSVSNRNQSGSLENIFPPSMSISPSVAPSAQVHSSGSSWSSQHMNDFSLSQVSTIVKNIVKSAGASTTTGMGDHFNAPSGILGQGDSEMRQLEQQARELYLMDPIQYNDVIDDLLQEAASKLLQDERETKKKTATEGILPSTFFMDHSMSLTDKLALSQSEDTIRSLTTAEKWELYQELAFCPTVSNLDKLALFKRLDLQNAGNIADKIAFSENLAENGTLSLEDKIVLFESLCLNEYLPDYLKLVLPQNAPVEEKQEYYQRVTHLMQLVQHEKLLMCYQLGANRTLPPFDKLSLYEEILSDKSISLKNAVDLYDVVLSPNHDYSSGKMAINERPAQSGNLSVDVLYQQHRPLGLHEAVGTMDNLASPDRESGNDALNEEEKVALYRAWDLQANMALEVQLALYEKLVVCENLSGNEKSAVFEHLAKNAKIPEKKKIELYELLTTSVALKEDEKEALFKQFAKDEHLSMDAKWTLYTALATNESLPNFQKLKLCKILALHQSTERSSSAPVVGLSFDDKESLYKKWGVDEKNDPEEVVAAYTSLVFDSTLTSDQWLAAFEHLDWNENLSEAGKLAVYEQWIKSEAIQDKEKDVLLHSFSKTGSISRNGKWGLYESLASDTSVSQKTKSTLFQKLAQNDVMPKKEFFGSTCVPERHKAFLVQQWGLNVEMPNNKKLALYHQLASQEGLSPFEKSALFEQLMLSEALPIHEKLTLLETFSSEHNIPLVERLYFYEMLVNGGSLPLTEKVSLYKKLVLDKCMTLEDNVAVYESLLRVKSIPLEDKVEFFEWLCVSDSLPLKDKIALFRYLSEDTRLPDEAKLELYKKITRDASIPIAARIALCKFLASNERDSLKVAHAVFTYIAENEKVSQVEKAAMYEGLALSREFPLYEKLLLFQQLFKDVGISVGMRVSLYDRIEVSEKLSFCDKLSLLDKVIHSAEIGLEEQYILFRKLGFSDEMFLQEPLVVDTVGSSLLKNEENMKKAVRMGKKALYEKIAIFDKIARSRRILLTEKLGLYHKFANVEKMPFNRKMSLYEQLFEFESIPVKDKISLYEQVKQNKTFSPLEKLALYESLSQLDNLSHEERVVLREKLREAQIPKGSRFPHDNNKFSLSFDGVQIRTDNLFSSGRSSYDMKSARSARRRVSTTAKPGTDGLPHGVSLTDPEGIYSSEVLRESTGDPQLVEDGKGTLSGHPAGKDIERTSSSSHPSMGGIGSQPFGDANFRSHSNSRTRLGSFLRSPKFIPTSKGKKQVTTLMMLSGNAHSNVDHDEDEGTQGVSSQGSWKPRAVSGSMIHISQVDVPKERKPSNCVEDIKDEVGSIIFEQMKAKLILKAVLEQMTKLWNGKAAGGTAEHTQLQAEKEYKDAQEAAWQLGRHRIINLNKLINLVDRKTGRVGGWLPVYTDDNVLVDSRGFPFISPVQRHLYRAMNLARHHRLLPLRLIRRNVVEKWNQHLLFGYRKCVIPNTNVDKKNKGLAPPRFRDMNTTGERMRYRRRLLRAAPFQHFSCLFSPRGRREVDFPFSIRHLL